MKMFGVCLGGVHMLPTQAVRQGAPKSKRSFQEEGEGWRTRILTPQPTHANSDDEILHIHITPMHPPLHPSFEPFVLSDL